MSKNNKVTGWKGTAVAGRRDPEVVVDGGAEVTGWKGTAVAGWKGTAVADGIQPETAYRCDASGHFVPAGLHTHEGEQ